jgi:Fur family transcriptional regulator, zinc uptake regulator
MDSKSAHPPLQDHSHCEGHGAHTHGLRLTAGRRAILDLLCAEARPLGAYDMIDKLAAQGGKRLAPISVYRALDFLLENGLVHRLSSRNAYLACGHRHAAHDPLVFLICESCGAVSERSSAPLGHNLDTLAGESDFTRRSQVVEVTGLCAACQCA